MQAKIAKYKEAKFTITQEKKFITALLSKPIELMTDEEIQIIENYRKIYKLLNWQGEFFPLAGIKVSCLKKILHFMADKGLFNSPGSLKAKCWFEISKQNNKKYLLVKLLKYNNHEIVDSANPIKLEIITDKKKISYKIADDYFYNEKDRINKLVFKSIQNINKQEEKFIDHFNWPGKFITLTGYFSPFPGNKIECLERWSSSLLSAGLIPEARGLNVKMKMSLDRIKDKKYLYIYALDNRQKIIKHNLNPIKIELDTEADSIKYKVAENYYYNDQDRKNKLILKDLSEYTIEDLEFFENYYWYDRFLNRQGGFSPFQGSVISCLQRFATAIQDKINPNNVRDIKVRMKVEVDLKKNKKFLKIWALKEEQVLDVDINPIQIELINNKKSIQYQVAKDYYYSYWDKLNDLILKQYKDFTEEEIEFIESFRWQRKFTHLWGGFFSLRGQRIMNLAAFAKRLYKRGLVPEIIGLPVEISIEIDTDKRRKYLIIQALNSQGQTIRDEAAVAIYQIKTMYKKVELIPAKDYFKKWEFTEYEFQKPECDVKHLRSAQYNEIYKPGKKIYFLASKNLHPEWIAHDNDEILIGTIKGYDGNFVEFEEFPGAFAIGYVSEDRQKLQQIVAEIENIKLVYSRGRKYRTNNFESYH